MLYIGDCYIEEISGFKQKRLFMIKGKTIFNPN